MRRVNWIAVAIALAAGPLVLIVQHWLRPAVPPDNVAWWVLGSAPNLIIALCVPFIIVARPIFTPVRAARAFTFMTLATLGVLVVMEIIRPIRAAGTFDPLDLAASVAGMALGALLYRRVAPRLRYAPAPYAGVADRAPPPA